MRCRPSTFVVLADQSYFSSWFFLPSSLFTVDGENSLSSQRNLWLWLFSGYTELDYRAVPRGHHGPWLDGAICAFVHGGGHVTHLGGRGGYRAPGLQNNFGACSWNWSRRSGPWFSFTGFPWGLVGYIWSGTPIAQMGAYMGIYGLTLLTVFICASSIIPTKRRNRVISMVGAL